MTFLEQLLGHKVDAARFFGYRSYSSRYDDDDEDEDYDDTYIEPLNYCEFYEELLESFPGKDFCVDLDDGYFEEDE